MNQNLDLTPRSFLGTWQGGAEEGGGELEQKEERGGGAGKRAPRSAVT